MTAGDSASVTVFVAVAPAVAFYRHLQGLAG
jgi:hypothetical protein